MPRFRIPLPMSDRSRRRRYFGRKAGIGGLATLLLVGLALLDRSGVFGGANQDEFKKYDGHTCKVVHVSDGDTLDVDIPDAGRLDTRIRLLGVDTAETVKPNTPVQYFGPQASSYTKSHTLHKTVSLQLDKSRTRDKYGRLLAYVLLDGRNFDLQLVEEGYGYADPRFAHPMLKEFKAAQEKAKSARLGLWAGVQDKDLPYYYQGKLKLNTP